MNFQSIQLWNEKKNAYDKAQLSYVLDRVDKNGQRHTIYLPRDPEQLQRIADHILLVKRTCETVLGIKKEESTES